MNQQTSKNDIAVVGLACRFPQSTSIDEFWLNLKQGKNLISYFTVAELLKAGIDKALLNHPQYVRAKGLLPDIDQFDHDFFKWSKMDADSTDPQHRVFLETVWTALFNAGFHEERGHERFGVFAACNTLNSYLYAHLFSRPELLKNLGAYYLALNNGPEFLATRVAYTFNFTGPAIFAHSACSSSLAVIQQACQSLLDFSCDMAIAGAVNWRTPHKTGYLYQEGMILSPDGLCRPFDQHAAGTVPSDGVGVVLLKRLTDALHDHNHIYAVIKSVAINNDGSKKMGFSAPSVGGQTQVIADALAIADIDGKDIRYVEAHGTATALGDPIEFAGLKQFYGLDTYNPTFLGSVKSNLGHLDVAAGMAGFIKAVLCLYHHEIPPMLHFSSYNPNIDHHNSGLKVNSELVRLNKSNQANYAAVSSFGIGGTNLHLILEQYQQEQKMANSSYIFQKTHCWIEAQSTPSVPAIVKPAIRDWYTVPCWALNPLDKKISDDKLKKKEYIVVIAATIADMEQISPLLKQHYLHILAFTHEQCDAKLKLGEVLQSTSIGSADFLYMPLFQPKTKKWQNANGYQTILTFFQAIQHFFSKPCNLYIVCSELYALTEAQPTNPMHYTIEGFSNVLSQEFPNWHCKTINFIDPMEQNWPKLVVEELTQITPDLKICYQYSQRYTKEYRGLTLVEDNKHPIIHAEGVYYITGGLGGMGLVVAEFLARIAPCQVILASRNGVQSLHQTEAIQRIEALGARVRVASVDIADFEALNQSVTALHAEGLAINGVIHAAGNIDPDSMYSMNEMSEEKLELHFAPKIRGLDNLIKALEKHKLDFFVCMSSLSTSLGGLKYSCYSAANNYLNGVALSRFRCSKTHWLSLNWDGWIYDNQHEKEQYEELKRILITPSEGLKVLADLFTFTTCPVINISVRNFYERYAAWKQAAIGLYSTRINKLNKQYKFADLYADIKIRWQHSLGLEDIDEDSDFYLSGGDSLLAVSMSHNISETYDIQFLPNHFLVNPTVYKQAKFIANLLGINTNEQE